VTGGTPSTFIYNDAAGLLANSVTAEKIDRASLWPIFVAADEDARYALEGIIPDEDGIVFQIDDGAFWYQIQPGLWHRGLPGVSSGKIGFASKITDQGGITTSVTDIGVSVTATVPVGRTVRISFKGGLYKPVIDGGCAMILRDGGNNELARWQVQHAQFSGQLEAFSSFHVEQGTGLSRTWKLSAQALIAGECEVKGTVTPVQLLVEDIGPWS
jgi:hypothetical protein